MRHRELHLLAPGLRFSTCPVHLGVFPTPITEARELAQAWDLAALYVKRDDLSAPEYGGTKVRALEYYLGEAFAEGRPGVVTLGAAGSHHVLTTALFANRVGLRCRAVLFPQPPSPEVEQTARVLGATGTEIVRAGSYLGVPLAWLRGTRRRLGAVRPYAIPPGGTGPLGVLGAAEGALEAVRQIEAGGGSRPDAVLVPAGSCGTAAGLLLGLALGGWSVPVVAVRVVPWVVARPARVRHLARVGLRVLRRAGFRGRVKLGPLHWVSGEAGRGYGHPTDAALQAVATVARLADFRAETTYTGKALAWLGRRSMAGRRVLFWNTFSAVDPLIP